MARSKVKERQSYSSTGSGARKKASNLATDMLILDLEHPIPIEKCTIVGEMNPSSVAVRTTATPYINRSTWTSSTAVAFGERCL